MFRIPSPEPDRRSLYLSTRELELAGREKEWLERIARAIECGLLTRAEAQSMVLARLGAARELRRRPVAA